MAIETKHGSKDCDQFFRSVQSLGDLTRQRVGTLVPGQKTAKIERPHFFSQGMRIFAGQSVVYDHPNGTQMGCQNKVDPILGSLRTFLRFNVFVLLQVSISDAITSPGRTEFEELNLNFNSVDLYVSSFSESLTKKCLGTTQQQLLTISDGYQKLTESNCKERSGLSSPSNEQK